MVSRDRSRLPFSQSVTHDKNVSIIESFLSLVPLHGFNQSPANVHLLFLNLPLPVPGQVPIILVQVTAGAS